ncbi:MAG: methylmalonyl Co-A mutase-associated GTPase MeaB [Acidimicrobiia bacterium]|jgi:LAO/AO transport system kinase
MARISDPAILLPKARDGDRRSLARLITLLEEDDAAGIEILEAVFPDGGRAWTTGLTGAPGAGKSTITDRLIDLIRETGDEVAVVAVDPSSPFSGGAVLGDRVRMQGHVDDRGVYVRSMASRGHLGGIAAATPRVVTLLDGLGFPEVVVETVGVGQAEVEIAGNADTTIVVVNPGWGDSVQAAKAGLLEIGDIFVVNKADRPGVHETIRDLTQMLDLGATEVWEPPILPTVAATGDGIPELWRAIADHRRHLEESGGLTEIRSRRLVAEMESYLMGELRKRIRQAISEEQWAELTARVAQRAVDPWSAAARLLRSGVPSD